MTKLTTQEIIDGLEEIAFFVEKNYPLVSAPCDRTYGHVIQQAAQRLKELDNQLPSRKVTEAASKLLRNPGSSKGVRSAAGSALRKEDESREDNDG